MEAVPPLTSPRPARDRLLSEGPRYPKMKFLSQTIATIPNIENLKTSINIT